MGMLTYQTIAKAFTEGLGRAPSAQDMIALHGAYGAGGCSITAITNYNRVVLTSPEAVSLAWTPAQRTNAAYRVMLNRCPTASEYVAAAAQSMSTLLTAIAKTQEYITLCGKVCACDGGSYGWGTTNIVGAQSGAALQTRLNSARAGSTVYITGRYLINAQLVIPAGVTLSSALNSAHPTKHAMLIRGRHFSTGGVYINQGIVKLSAGSAIEHLTIDGRRTDLGYNEQACNVEIAGSNARVQFIKSMNSAGWTNIFGSPHHGPITDIRISDNLITGYPHSRDKVNGLPAWTDGISFSCLSGTIERNKVIDASDVGIILFPAREARSEALVRNNSIYNVGVDTYAMFGVDQLMAPADFGRAVFEANEVYTAGRTTARAGVINGSMMWSATRVPMTAAPQYRGNYGVIQYEVFGSVTDQPPLMNHPNISFIENRRGNLNSGCKRKVHAISGPDKTTGCL